MIRRCLNLLVLLSMLMCLSVAEAKTKQHYSSPITLDDYIHVHCKKQCAGQEEILKSVRSVARKLDIDFKDLLTIMKVESSFKPKARSKSNVGLMQVNLKYHRKKFKGRDPFNIQANVEVGGGIYKDCLVKYDDNKPRAMDCYNGSGDRKYKKKINMVSKEINELIFEEEEMVAIKVNIVSRPEDKPLDEGVADIFKLIVLDAYKGFTVRAMKPEPGEFYEDGKEPLGCEGKPIWSAVLIREDDRVCSLLGQRTKKDAELAMKQLMDLQ